MDYFVKVFILFVALGIGKMVSKLAVLYLKRFLSKTAGKSLFYLTGLPTSDVTNSFKLYSKECINSVKFESSGGFEIGMEIVVKSYLIGLAISEVPTFWKDRFEGTSNFKLRQWLPYYLRWYFKILFSQKHKKIGITILEKLDIK